MSPPVGQRGAMLGATKPRSAWSDTHLPPLPSRTAPWHTALAWGWYKHMQIRFLPNIPKLMPAELWLLFLPCTGEVSAVWGPPQLKEINLLCDSQEISPHLKVKYPFLLSHNCLFTSKLCYVCFLLMLNFCDMVNDVLLQINWMCTKSVSRLSLLLLFLFVERKRWGEKKQYHWCFIFRISFFGKMEIWMHKWMRTRQDPGGNFWWSRWGQWREVINVGGWGWVGSGLGFLHDTSLRLTSLFLSWMQDHLYNLSATPWKDASSDMLLLLVLHPGETVTYSMFRGENMPGNSSVTKNQFCFVSFFKNAWTHCL